jgi:hypothetical protein
MGINEAGSVDMEASSKKTTGKSTTLSAADADVMHVVQICSQSGTSSNTQKKTHHIRFRDDIP